MILRICIAGALCGLVGLEREMKKHPAGFRTHLLVGVGSCLVMLLSIYGFRDFLSTNGNIRFDPSRLPSYVISGIGFLGAGTILVQGATVRGLTTAASIWVVSGIGIVVGDGLYAIAIFTTIVVISSLIFLNKWEQIYIKTTRMQSLNMTINHEMLRLSDVLRLIKQQGITLNRTDVKKLGEDPQKHLLEVRLIISYSNYEQVVLLLEQLTNLQAVKKITTTD